MLHWTWNLKVVPKRTFPAAVTVGNKVYSFGGYTNMIDRGRIHVHIFNTVSLVWMKLPRVTTGKRRRTLYVPTNRVCHTAVLIEDIIYIWGGQVDFKIIKEDISDWVATQGRYCNMIYAFNVDTHGWLKANTSGTVPEGREDHSASVLGNVMYIHGGWNKLTGFSNDTYKLDSKTMVWSLINSRGAMPPVSFGHSATIIGTKVFVFGGEGDQDDGYNTVRVFDTETNCWMNLPSVQPLPEPRRGHSAFTYNGELYIFGGYNGNKEVNYFADMWKFNTETFSWKKVEAKGIGPCKFTEGCCCMVGDRIIFFAEIYNGLFILDLVPSMKTLCKLAVIRYGLEQSGLPHNIRWELAAMTTDSNNGYNLRSTVCPG